MTIYYLSYLLYILGFICISLSISFLFAIKFRIIKFIEGIIWIRWYSEKIKAPYTFNKNQIPQMLFRISTCWFRSYPSIYIIGEMKCGTTSLNDYLNQHPQIKCSNQFIKEPHFFEGRSIFRDNFEDCPWLYKSFFDWKWKKSIYQIDATPQKLFLTFILHKIKKITPNAKIIICVREPVSRAISNYSMLYNRKKEIRDINQLFNDKLNEQYSQLQQLQLENKSIKPYIDSHQFIFPQLDYQYISRGNYIDKIRICDKLFGKNMVIINQKELLKNPINVLDNIFKFLSIPNIKNIKITEKNKGIIIPVLNDEIKNKMNKYYEKSNQELFNEYGINLID